MILHYFDLQDRASTLNGTRLERPDELVALLESSKTREPFMFELRGDNGYTLTIGIASESGCVQHTASNGALPYGVAVSLQQTCGFDLTFLCGNTPTPVESRRCIEYELIKEVALEFLKTGERSAAVCWEEI